MAKREIKTKENEASVEDFINLIEDETKREDCRKIAVMMEKASGKPPKMWGTSIIGFDQYHYKYDSGTEGDMCRIGFSPRKQNMVVYIVDGFEKYTELLSKLGKHSNGKSCLYFKKLSDIDENILKELIELSVKWFNDKYGKN